ncbi:MAG: RpiB/LacA/LacB family sugar-phosphate isomerase [Candidatus Sumerlaeia bacterium]|nr:RpiB/LacA/LacB family sugar-phosphate isomerase [Candidatus Sumerlaeia bacterium]
MRIALASDHAGFIFRRAISFELGSQGHAIEDFGCPSEDAADLVDFVAPAAEALGKGRFDFGIFIDGAGYGPGMIANFFHGVFAAVANDPVAARLAREHGGANALCLGTKVAGELVLRETVKAFLAAEPLPGKYQERREKVRAVAERQRVGPMFRKRAVVTVDDLKEAVLQRQPLIIDRDTVVTPSVLEAVRSLRP